MTMKDLPVWPVYTIEGDSLDVTVNPAGEPFTSQIAIPTKDTEQSLALPFGTKRYMIKLDKGHMEYGYSTGARNFVVSKGSGVEITGIDPTKQITLYFSSSSDSDTLRVDYWK